MSVVMKLCVVVKPFWIIQFDTREGMVFKSTNNAHFGCRFTRCAVLIHQIPRCSCMWRGCPPTNALSFPATKHTSVWHMPWQTGINGLTSIFTTLCPSSRDYKITATTKTACRVCAMEKKNNIPSGLRDMDIIRFVLDCHWERRGCDKRSLYPSDSIGSWTLSLCKLQSITLQNSSKIGST